MKTWYQTREASQAINHRGVRIEAGKKILLTEEQANLHNQDGKVEALIATEPPQSPAEAGVLSEYKNWLSESKTSPIAAPEVATTIQSEDL